MKAVSVPSLVITNLSETFTSVSKTLNSPVTLKLPLIVKSLLTVKLEFNLIRLLLTFWKLVKSSTLLSIIFVLSINFVSNWRIWLDVLTKFSLILISWPFNKFKLSIVPLFIVPFNVILLTIKLLSIVKSESNLILPFSSILILLVFASIFLI